MGERNRKNEMTFPEEKEIIIKNIIKIKPKLKLK